MFLKANAKRVVVKVGTNTLAHPDGSLDLDRIASIARQINDLKQNGLQIILVSSGAVGVGMGRLQLSKRPKALAQLQACAAIGQSHLMQAWQQAFAQFKIETAQVLLTREDVRSRSRHLAIRNTLDELIHQSVLPILNENDTVSAAEIKFGDNDILSAMTASLLKADLLVILSTAKGLIDLHGSGEIIKVIDVITPEIRKMAGGSLNERSTGGMITKLEAAEIATKSGCGVFIGDGCSNSILPDLLTGQSEGTFFLPHRIPLIARKRWLAFFEKPLGTLYVDDGAAQALTTKGSSLLAKGITQIEGSFDENQIVTVAGPNQEILGRGVVRYDSKSLLSIIGLSSTEIKKKLPSRRKFEVIHRDQWVQL